MESTESNTKPPTSKPRAWSILIGVWLLVLPSAVWWFTIHFVLNVPFHPHWNTPVTVGLLCACLVAWIWALRKWLRSEAVRGTSRWPTGASKQAVLGALAVLLTFAVLASMLLTGLRAWTYDGDSTGSSGYGAYTGCLHIQAQLAIHAGRHGDLSGIKSGRAVDSGLMLDRSQFDDVWPGNWSADDFYIEIHGEAPEYKGTIIYAHGRYWPWDNSSPTMKDYGVATSDVRSFDDYHSFQRWSE